MLLDERSRESQRYGKLAKRDVKHRATEPRRRTAESDSAVLLRGSVALCLTSLFRREPMIRKSITLLALSAALIVPLVWSAQQATSALPSTKNGEWPMYTADLRGSKYSPPDQIDATNFNKLQVAWSFKT